MKKYWLLTLHFIKLSVMSRMAYKPDFIAWSLVTLGWVTFTFIFYELLFANITTIAGWSKGQIYVLQGFVFLAEFLVWGFFYYSLKFLPDQIAYGEIDKVIVKPINTQYALSVRGFGIQHITSLLTGLFTINYGLNLAQAQLSWLNVGLVLVICFFSGIMLYALYFLAVCLSFWFDKLSNVIYLVPNSLDLAKVPQNAYSGLTKVSLTYVVPVILATSLPTGILFGAPQWDLMAYLVIFSLGILAFSHFVLKQGLKVYSSASS